MRIFAHAETPPEVDTEITALNSKIQAEKQKELEERQSKYASACTLKKGDPIIISVITDGNVDEFECTFVKRTQSKMSYQRNDNGAVAAGATSKAASGASAPLAPSASVDTPPPQESSTAQTVKFPELPDGATSNQKKEYRKLKHRYHVSVGDAKKVKDPTQNQSRQKTNLDKVMKFYTEVNGAITNRATEPVILTADWH